MAEIIPLGVINSIIKLGIKVAKKLKEVTEITRDSSELIALVKRVVFLVRDAPKELDPRQLSKASAVSALKALEETMAACNKIVEDLTKKSKIVKFLSSGDHLASIKGVMARMERNLGVFQAALSIEQHADLKKTITQLRRDLNRVSLPDLRNFEVQASQLRNVMESLQESLRSNGGRRGQADAAALKAQIHDAVMSGLREAGVVGSADRVSQQESAEVSAALRKEMESLRRDKRAMDEEYFAQILAALSLAEGDSGSSGGGSTSDPTRSASSQRSSPLLKVPGEFTCPITLCVMRDPVMLVETGHSFERSAIERHLATNSTNPVTNLVVRSKDVAPNNALGKDIQEWLISHGLTHDQADTLGVEVPQQQGLALPSRAGIEPLRLGHELSQSSEAATRGVHGFKSLIDSAGPTLPEPGRQAVHLLSVLLGLGDTAHANRDLLRDLHSRAAALMDILTTYNTSLEGPHRSRISGYYSELTDTLTLIAKYAQGYQERNPLLRLLTGSSDREEIERLKARLAELVERVSLELRANISAQLRELKGKQTCPDVLQRAD